ncbi:hypothetical protein [Marinospirillum alkaliphilum]|uniref:Acyl-coenzyme A thioesterase PaaI, contains HGG motif n=1 Tax=Marinospirillum alkaliphilum DSM 21637 TaxID=1122209 RepID=A0A1K2A108_9GAMM|nr:hypothetical protein [Marinospirillum alkaliphilum]SFX80142.1 hypothetical protein SAMN02745752_02929 [Marinospirillum alkaliphilum DSM 21637]
MPLALPPAWEIRLNKLTMKSAFAHQLLALIFMPFLARSRLKVNYDPADFYAYLPRNRFNTNWYGSQSGAAILAHSELAAGACVFMLTQGEYRMVCTHLEYNFLLPSTDPVIYKVELDQVELEKKRAAGGKFMVDLTIKVYRATSKTTTGKRIGSGKIGFKVWPVGE